MTTPKYLYGDHEACEAAPSKDEISSLRKSVGVSQDDAAKMLRSCRNTYIKWESGRNKMHPAIFELFQLKIAAYRMAHPDASPTVDLPSAADLRRAHVEAIAEGNARIGRTVRLDPFRSCLEGPPADVVNWLHRPSPSARVVCGMGMLA